jgi:hypothetical protein
MQPNVCFWLTQFLIKEYREMFKDLDDNMKQEMIDNTFELGEEGYWNEGLSNFIELISKGFREVDQKTYANFLEVMIIKPQTPTEAKLLVVEHRKIVGAAFIELEIDTHDLFGNMFEQKMGTQPAYMHKHSMEGEEDIFSYGWLEDLNHPERPKQFFINEELYPSWFNKNVIHI